ncbi:ATP-grasp domain-containing protein [Xanthobacter sp. VNH20]|uniref:ATP-grasp domain-containing protein n=1 Tax=Xanthobacter sp. VNH20 TaxID=3156616 RepID=UPI0032B38A53
MDLAVIALSARPLAASAARAGFAALSLDLFADLDTCANAARCVRVHKKNGFSFDGDDLIQALTNLSPPGLPVVLGGGFEDDTQLMTRIAERNPILGNMAETVRVLKDPLALAALCGHLGIAFPPVTLDTPQGELAQGPLLEKKIGGAGGSHIRRRAPEETGPPAPGHYLQREVSGTAYSLLVLSNGKEALPVGASWQWSHADTTHPFRYGGAVGPVPLPAKHAAAIIAGALRIATVCGLVGLISVDVLVEADRWWLVEINPRIGASIDIFDVEPMPPLLALHLAACGGKLPKGLPQPKGATAAGILYADSDVMIPAGAWPDHVCDRTAAGTIIPAGAPICTVKRTAGDMSAAVAQVRDGLAEMRSRLGLPQSQQVASSDA